MHIRSPPSFFGAKRMELPQGLFLGRIVESGCVTLQSLVLSISIMCKDF
jgi:hypothetical protein